MSDIADDIKKEIDKCIECETCMEEGICPSYFATGERLLSPLGRIYSLKELISGKKECKDIAESLLTCSTCGRCMEVCPVDVDVAGAVIMGRRILYKRGIIPTERQKTIIESILDKGNAVSREESQKIIYRDEFYRKFLGRSSNTLLFLGCISSFFLENAVRSAISFLDSLGVDFFITDNELCCGIFLYDGGYDDKARDYFRRNTEKLLEKNVKEIITLCASCYKCFSVYYKEILGELPFRVRHFIEVVYEHIAKGVEKIGNGKKYILHDPCKLSRYMGILDEPRIVLKRFGISFDEFSQKANMSLCCGAGGGVRSYKPALSIEIAGRVLEEAGKRDIITLCPFCVFNFNYSAKKKNLTTRALYISEVLWKKST